MSTVLSFERLFIFSILILVLAGRGSSIAGSLENKIWTYKNGRHFVVSAGGGGTFEQTRDFAQIRESEPGFDLNENDIAKFHIWPLGKIPYYIDDFSFDKVQRDRIRSFLERVNSMTGLHFLELPRPPDDENYRWVLFINRQGQLACSDYPFSYYTNKGVQIIVLGYNCLNAGRQLPPIVLSLVGVPPQHNSPDRWKTISIHLENMLPGKERFFVPLDDKKWLFHDVPYDINSAGHYSPHKYTSNGFATLKLRMNVTNTEVGKGTDFSYGDIWKIVMLYAYISKNKTSEGQRTVCKKLFNCGSNFSNYELESDDEIAPRHKPPAYLGLKSAAKDSDQLSRGSLQKSIKGFNFGTG